MNDKIPVHVAIIPDGNRRWAKERGLPTLEGHRRGFDIAIKLSNKARELGVKILSLWAFSTENWDRTTQEVGYLMKLYEQMIDRQLKEAMKNHTRLIHIGRKDRISVSLKEKIVNAEGETSKFDNNYLIIALDYGGRDEIIRAINTIKDSKSNIGKIDEKNFNQFLDTRNLPQPDPDLIIRTSGENRWSGFMMWQSAYSEYMFIDKYFPDFTPQDLENCIIQFNQRNRRFGK